MEPAGRAPRANRSKQAGERFAQSSPDQTCASETSSRKSNQTITNNHPDGTSSSCEPDGPTERTALEPRTSLEVHLCRHLLPLPLELRVPRARAGRLAAFTAFPSQATQGSVAGTAGYAQALLYRRTTSTVCQRILSNQPLRRSGGVGAI